MPIHLAEEKPLIKHFQEVSYGQLFKLIDIDGKPKNTIYMKCYWPKGPDVAIDLKHGTILDIEKHIPCWMILPGTKIELK